MKLLVSLLGASLLAAPSTRAVLPAGQVGWELDLGGNVLGPATPFGPVEQAGGVLATRRSGEVLLVGPRGEKHFTMILDRPAETPAVAADLEGKGHLSVVAVDGWGSIYCFDEHGQRRWKYARTVQSGDLRWPVFLPHGNQGEQAILVPDSRGHLVALDSQGRQWLEVSATRYRVSVPAVGDVNGDGQPEIFFGTEGGEVYCASDRGELVWARSLSGCFGRTLPLVADANGDGPYEVYLSTAFNNPQPGLFALAAATGQPLWKAPSVMQSYRSTVVCDLDGDGRNEVLYGDKNTSLYCLGATGERRWTTQLKGRGIFSAPAVADLQGNGSGTLFITVRDAGSDGKSLYTLDAQGKVLDELELPGGGGASPLLCRFRGQTDLSLVVMPGSGRLRCYRPEQKSSAAKILWAGVRNDPANAGFVKSAHPARSPAPGPAPEATQAHARAVAQGGFNPLPLPSSVPGAETISLRTVRPDQSVRLELYSVEPSSGQTDLGFSTDQPGDYDVTLRWHAADGRRVLREERFRYRLDREPRADQKQLASLQQALRTLAQRSPRLNPLAARLQTDAAAALERAGLSQSSADFDAWRAQSQQIGALIRAVADPAIDGTLLVRQLDDPWETAPGPGLSGDRSHAANPVRVQMLGNEYESAVITLTSLQPVPATFHLACGPFECSSRQVAASEVLELREVLRVAPYGTDAPVEDALPRLGEGQTVRLEPGETKKIWLTLHSRALAAGTWQAALRAGDIAAADPPVSIPIRVEVDRVRLPDQRAYHECNWLYLDGLRDATVREATARDALEHGMNVFVLPGVSLPVDAQGRPGEASSAAHDQLVHELNGRAFLLISGPVSLQWPAGAHPDAATQAGAFAQALRWYAGHMQSLGCPFSDFAIYIQDEPGLMGRDANFEAFVARVKEFKAAEPRLQIYANPAGGARAELLQPLQDLIDVWAPDLHLVREQPEALKRIFQHGKYYWHYEAPADQRDLDPLGFYRMKPWVAYQMGMTGGGYWVYSSAAYWFADPNAGVEYGAIYPTERGPVTTKRWEASRDGIEDFELLWLLKQTAALSPAEARQRAEALIDEAVQFVTRGQEHVTDISRHLHPYTPDFRRWMDYRRRLIEMQRQLGGSYK